MLVLVATCTGALAQGTAPPADGGSTPTPSGSDLPDTRAAQRQGVAPNSGIVGTGSSGPVSGRQAGRASASPALPPGERRAVPNAPAAPMQPAGRAGPDSRD